MAKTTTTTTQTTQRTREGTHSIQHIEIVSTEPVKLKKFLEKQFGWKFETQPMPGGAGEYHMFRTPDGNGGGVLQPQNPGQPVAVTPYINVADCAATEKSCQKNGATILMPTTDIPGMGRFFVFQFPNSPALACWQATGAPR